MAIPLIFLFRNPEVLWLSLRNACVLSLQLCLTLCDPTDCRGGSSVHRILQQEYWRGLPFPPPGDVSDPGIDTPSLLSPSLTGGFFPTCATWERPASRDVCLPPIPLAVSLVQNLFIPGLFCYDTHLNFYPFQFTLHTITDQSS